MYRFTQYRTVVTKANNLLFLNIFLHRKKRPGGGLIYILIRLINKLVIQIKDEATKQAQKKDA